MSQICGVREVYIIDSGYIANSGITVSESAHTITAISTLSGGTFETFMFNRNTGNLTTESAIDLVNGSTSYNTTLALFFRRREASKSRALQLLGAGQRYLDIIVKTANDDYWYLREAQMNGGTEQTGTVTTDKNGYDVTFLSEMNHRTYLVDPTVIASLGLDA